MQNMRGLICSRQVTTMISHHTFSNLVLRPSGGTPTPSVTTASRSETPGDEEGLKALGARMTAANGYRNIHGWELYDTTGPPPRATCRARRRAPSLDPGSGRLRPPGRQPRVGEPVVHADRLAVRRAHGGGGEARHRELDALVREGRPDPRAGAGGRRPRRAGEGRPLDLCQALEPTDLTAPFRHVPRPDACPAGPRA